MFVLFICWKYEKLFISIAHVVGLAIVVNEKHVLIYNFNLLQRFDHFEAAEFDCVIVLETPQVQVKFGAQWDEHFLSTDLLKVDNALSVDCEPRVYITCHIKPYKDYMTFWKSNYQEIIIGIVFSIEIQIITLRWRWAIQCSNSVFFRLFTDLFDHSVMKQFTVEVRGYDRGEHDGSDLSGWQIFTFRVSKINGVLHQF